MPEAALATVLAYHQRSKHQLQRYAAGPETLDWDAQPDPFRRYAGAPLTPLPLAAAEETAPWAALFEPGALPARPLDRASLGLLFELSLALAAWKQAGPDRWALRINPSSGNLHPTEGWLIAQGLPGLPDGLHHYAPEAHALELRAASAAPAGSPPRAWIALSSLHWREAWKYGERALRYSLLDSGHALGALRYAAALCGWSLRTVPLPAAQLGPLLGLDRDGDFGAAERDDPELLLELVTDPARPPAVPALRDDAVWHGQPNRLDRHPMYRWPVIDQAAAASHQGEPPAPLTVSAPPPLPRSRMPAAVLIRQRRSAQRFDARARLPLARLWPLLQALHPGRLPFDIAPGGPALQLLLFAHRVDGLPTGAYLLPRGPQGLATLQAALPLMEQAEPVPGAPADAPLWRLAENPGLPGTLRTLNCHQALGSDALLGLALLAPRPASAAAWRAALQQAGLLGQALYLEAEAAGLRGTGIGCFFDDALHQLIGLPEPAADTAALQSVYHFTLGLPLHDERLRTEPPYAHLAPRGPDGEPLP